MRVGSLFAGHGGHLRAVEEVHHHPNFTGLTNTHSVVLLKLNGAATLAGVARLSSVIPKFRSIVTLYGFDQLKRGQDSLKTLRMTVQSNSVCHKLMGVMRLFAESSFCVTGATNKKIPTTCWGDKGAPVVRSDNLQLIGVLLSPGGCQDLESENAEVVVPISRVIRWITTTVGEKRAENFLE